MSRLDIFVWGLSAGYVIRVLVSTGERIIQARREAKAAIERALANRERQP